MRSSSPQRETETLQLTDLSPTEIERLSILERERDFLAHRERERETLWPTDCREVCDSLERERERERERDPLLPREREILSGPQSVGKCVRASSPHRERQTL